MQEILKFNERLKAQRKTATLLSASLFIGGVALCLPLFADTTKYPETLFCFNPNADVCEGQQIKRGISWMIDRERRNFTFDTKVKFLKVIPPDAPKAPLYGVLGTVLLFGAYGVSKSLTDTQEKAIHSQFSLLKIKALENDIYVSNHLDLTAFSKQHQSQITKEIIARDTAGAIEQLKSEGEQQLDHINGQLQGEVALKSHQLQLSELDKETAKNHLETAEINRKLDKLNKPTNDTGTSATQTPKDTLKNALIDALKSHEDGYLWTIINSLKPLWLIGNQGSGKTYTAGAIALIRKYCLDAPVHQLIDRHATGDNAEVWKLLQAYTLAETEEDISTAFDECCDRWLQRIKQKPKTKQQVICDEFTNLKSLCGDSAINFFKMSLTDTRKSKEYLLGITHNATNESFPDGTAAARKSGTILLEKFSANGETPLSRVVVRYGLVDALGNSLEDIEKTLPDWFHPGKIYDHFDGKPIIFED